MVPAFMEEEIKTNMKNTKIMRQLNLNRLCWDVFNCNTPPPGPRPADTHTHTHTHTSHTHTHTVIAGFSLSGEFHRQRNLAGYRP